MKKIKILVKIHKYGQNANFFISIILCLLGAHTYNSSSETTYPHCVRMYNIYRSKHVGTGIDFTTQNNLRKKRVGVVNLTVLRAIYHIYRERDRETFLFLKKT